jgi:hypothetical protein
MATTPLIGALDPELARKIRALLALADAGRWRPDPLMLAWAAGVLKDHGELALARDCERIVRRHFPNYRRDLT